MKKLMAALLLCITVILLMSCKNNSVEETESSEEIISCPVYKSYDNIGDFKLAWHGAQHFPENSMYTEEKSMVVAVPNSSLVEVERLIPKSYTYCVYQDESQRDNDRVLNTLTNGRKRNRFTVIVKVYERDGSFEDLLEDYNEVSENGMALVDDTGGWCNFWILDNNGRAITVLFSKELDMATPEKLYEYFTFEEWTVETE